LQHVKANLATWHGGWGVTVGQESMAKQTKHAKKKERLVPYQSKQSVTCPHGCGKTMMRSSVAKHTKDKHPNVEPQRTTQSTLMHTPFRSRPTAQPGPSIQGPPHVVIYIPALDSTAVPSGQAGPSHNPPAPNQTPAEHVIDIELPTVGTTPQSRQAGPDTHSSWASTFSIMPLVKSTVAAACKPLVLSVHSLKQAFDSIGDKVADKVCFFSLRFSPG
jgi:hypothetical protein